MTETSLHFVQLLLSLQTGTMVHLGKIASPISGKIERDLAQARATIDLLDALRTKTEGNLSSDEKSLLDRALYDLRINFLDESARGETLEAETGVNSPPKASDN